MQTWRARLLLQKRNQETGWNRVIRLNFLAQMMTSKTMWNQFEFVGECQNFNTTPTWSQQLWVVSLLHGQSISHLMCVASQRQINVRVNSKLSPQLSEKHSRRTPQFSLVVLVFQAQISAANSHRQVATHKAFPAQCTERHKGVEPCWPCWTPTFGQHNWHVLL